MNEPEEVLEADAVEEPAAPEGVRTTRALEPASAPAAAVSVTPQVSAEELGARLKVITEAMEKEMQEGVDYGKVPGTDKPALFKPGSEKLSVLFKLDVQPRSTKTWGPGEHLTVETAATVFDIESGARIGFGEGLCTTREKKYGKRTASRVCPTCHQEAIIKGKEEYGGGWVCFHKKGGCGAKFADDEEAIIGQKVGEVVNPDLPDMWNTVVKMAEKRARVDAVLAVTGASAIFTQDLDEATTEEGTEAPGLQLADEEQKAQLARALEYLLPKAEAERVWGEIKVAFGGGLYGPAAEAAVAPIRALKAIHDDEKESDEEAKADEAAQDESGESAEEKREREAREKAGKKREKKS